MKNLKRVLVVLAIISVGVMALTACGAKNEDSKSKSSKKERNIDKDNHWYEDEKGKISEKGKHSFKDDKCKECGATIEKDGKDVTVILYNEYDHPIIYRSYRGNELEDDLTYEYVYDKKGNKLVEKEYDDGKLVYEEKIKHEKKDGEDIYYTEYKTTYEDDGTKLVEKCDEDTWVIKETMYNKDGSVKYDYDIKNEFNDENLISSIKKYDGKKLVEELKSEYDKDGNVIKEKQYKEEKLVLETKFTNLDGYIYVSEVIEYKEDGKKEVVKFDENGNLIK